MHWRLWLKAQEELSQKKLLYLQKEMRQKERILSFFRSFLCFGNARMEAMRFKKQKCKDRSQKRMCLSTFLRWSTAASAAFFLWRTLRILAELI